MLVPYSKTQYYLKRIKIRQIIEFESQGPPQPTSRPSAVLFRITVSFILLFPARKAACCYLSITAHLQTACHFPFYIVLSLCLLKCLSSVCFISSQWHPLLCTHFTRLSQHCLPLWPVVCAWEQEQWPFHFFIFCNDKYVNLPKLDV